MKNMRNGLPPIHPGKFLREMLEEMALTQAALAQAIGISPGRASRLLRGQRPMTAELALRLGRALGQTPQYWLNLQSAHDLTVARTKMEDSLLAIRPLVAP